MFMKLGWGLPYSQESKHKWGFMTLDSLEIYRKIYSILADSAGEISGKLMTESKFVTEILLFLGKVKER